MTVQRECTECASHLIPHKPGYNAASLRFGGEMLELDDMLFMNAGCPAAVKFVKDENFAAMNGPFL